MLTIDYGYQAPRYYNPTRRQGNSTMLYQHHEIMTYIGILGDKILRLMWILLHWKNREFCQDWKI